MKHKEGREEFRPNIASDSTMKFSRNRKEGKEVFQNIAISLESNIVPTDQDPLGKESKRKNVEVSKHKKISVLLNL